MNKLILNIQFSANIKFKIAYDTANNTKTFADLKQLCIARLQQFSKVATEQLKAELPSTFLDADYLLQDNNNFSFSDTDEVDGLCSNNDTLQLVYIQNIQPNTQTNLDTSLSSSLKPQSLTQVVQPQSEQIFPDESQNKINIQPQQPQQQQQPQQPQQSPQPFTPFKVEIPKPQQVNVQQYNNEYLSQNEIENLKQSYYLNTSFIDGYQQLGDFELQLQFPQAQDPMMSYTYRIDKDSTLHELSCAVCQTLKLDAQKYTIALYSQSGLPFYSWLNQMHTKTVQSALGAQKSKQFIAIVTQCQAGPASLPKLDPEDGTEQIFVQCEGTKVIRVNITDTIEKLKQKIYSKTNIPTGLQNLYYGGKPLLNDQTLYNYNIQANSNINITVSQQYIVGRSSSYANNFFSPWLNHKIKQTQEGERQFRSHCLVFFKHKNDIRFLVLIRKLTNNNSPLVLTLWNLMKHGRLNQLQKIALEEGMMRLFFDLMVESKKVANLFALDKIFEYSRQCLNVLYLAQNKLDKQVQLYKQENYMLFDKLCSATFLPINRVGLLQPDPQNTDEQSWMLVDYDIISKKMEDNESNPNKIPYKELKLIEPDWVREEYLNMMNLDHGECYVWIPKQIAEITDMSINLPPDWNLNKDTIQDGVFKIYSSTELKNHPNVPVLTKNQTQKLVIYTSMNKDVNNPVNIFDVISGLECAANPDQMAYQNLKNAHNVGDDIKLVTQISTPPDEAIIVLLDISGSMDESFYKSQDLTRMGVVKAFFGAFADRTMAYNLKNVISLAYFDHRYEVKCGFTETFIQFKELVNNAQPSGSTALYNALHNAVDALLEFRKQYPDSILRIIALTDGEDNKSKYTAKQVAEYILINQILIDSFVVSEKCDGLKQITYAAGGKCFCPKTIQEGLKLFEFETILTAKFRKPQQQLTLKQLQASFLKDVKDIIFDKQPYDMSLPNQIERQSVNPNKLVSQISQDSNQLNIIAPSQTLKRVMKEIINYQTKPHPFIRIFPCLDDISFWKLILIGPEDTPYFGGIYMLYMKFPSTYPTSPPELRFLTPIYHCNINAQGRICHSILDRNYSNDLRVLSIFEQIYGLLMTPEPDDPLDTMIASEYISDLQTYRHNATQHTEKNAKKPLDQVIQELVGNADGQQYLSDVELQEKVQEINSWINISTGQN